MVRQRVVNLTQSERGKDRCYSGTVQGPIRPPYARSAVKVPVPIPHPPALIVAGPTASGKSALALAIAERLGGTIINADSMQVYRELRILTARPTPEDEARVPHAPLRHPTRGRSRQRRLVAQPRPSPRWQAAQALGSLPILTGGTGLYFAALTDGLADIPDPGAEARAEARRLLAELGPRGAARRPRQGRSRHRRPAQTQRQPAHRPRLGGVARHRHGPRRLADSAIAARAVALLRHPCSIRRARHCAPPSPPASPPCWPRARSRRCAALLALDLDPALPAMRAHGVPELSAYLRGTLSLEEAGRRTELVTGQYTKRQATWFRHHDLAAPSASEIRSMRDLQRLTQFSERVMDEIIRVYSRPGLTHRGIRPIHPLREHRSPAPDREPPRRHAPIEPPKCRPPTVCQEPKSFFAP